MKSFYTREDNEVLQQIREELAAGNPVKVVNTYETFYGCGFDRWLRDGIADIPCEIEVTEWNRFPDCNYPWEYEITQIV